MKYLKTFESFRGWPVTKLSNFSTEDLEDLLEEFQDIVESYGLKDWQVLFDEAEESEKGEVWDNLIEEGSSFFYVNSARNAFIEAIYFGEDKDEFISDLKSFVRKIDSLFGWKTYSLTGKDGFSKEKGQNENGEEYLHCNLVFHKKINEGIFDFFKRKETEDDKIAIEFLKRLEKIKDKSPYKIIDLDENSLPHWISELPKENVSSYYSQVYMVKFDDVDLVTTNDRSHEGKCWYPWKLCIGNESIAEIINANDRLRKKVFQIVDKIYKRDKEIKRIERIKKEINPDADQL